MTLQQLRYLLAVVEHGGMTAAAQALFVDQSALSRSLQALERELKADLFVRSGRGVVPTPEGTRIARLAKKLLGGVREIEATFRTPVEEPSGRLTLGGTQSLAIELITSVVPQFRARHPGCRVEVIPFDGPEPAAEAARSGTVDLLLVDLPAPSDLKVMPLRHLEIVLLSPPAVRLPDPVPWEAMRGLPLIMPTPGSKRRAQFEQLFARHGVVPTVAMETDERGAWVSCVAAGHGSLLWYRDLADRFASLVAVRSLSPPLIRTMAFAWARRPLTLEARALLEDARSRGVEETKYI
ncbi:LysR family transcriptional regulator [Yinghuangia seranimata]|uniref:LysR family transcriptional regulator n=1 Tax=Yinghuangia seranimata TaxID=408067 RepID=UPI00248BE1CF|nr:LysR family transcriptional regulator [Yinghuangia seranimata]MDI2126587.1 LysR family transcriptional regulator [Yinghuangia seranimata]